MKRSTLSILSRAVHAMSRNPIAAQSARIQAIECARACIPASLDEQARLFREYMAVLLCLSTNALEATCTIRIDHGQSVHAPQVELPGGTHIVAMAWPPPSGQWWPIALQYMCECGFEYEGEVCLTLASLKYRYAVEDIPAPPHDNCFISLV